MSSGYLQFRDLMIKYSGMDRENWHYFDLGWKFRVTLLRLDLMDLNDGRRIKF